MYCWWYIDEIIEYFVGDINLGENAMKGKCRLMPNQTKLSGWTPGLLQQIIHASKREIKRVKKTKNGSFLASIFFV